MDNQPRTIWGREPATGDGPCPRPGGRRVRPQHRGRPDRRDPRRHRGDPGAHHARPGGPVSSQTGTSRASSLGRRPLDRSMSYCLRRDGRLDGGCGSSVSGPSERGETAPRRQGSGLRQIGGPRWSRSAGASTQVRDDRPLDQLTRGVCARTGGRAAELGCYAALSTHATPRQIHVLAACVAGGGSAVIAAELVGIQPSTVKRHLADLRARSGLTTEQLIYGSGRWVARRTVPGAWLRVSSARTTEPAPSHAQYPKALRTLAPIVLPACRFVVPGSPSSIWPPH